MPKRIYKLTSLPAVEDGIDSKIYFKTPMTDGALVMLMKVWMYKLAEVVEEYYFTEDEMMKMLNCFGCKQVAEESVEIYYSADMYEIWEAANIRPTEEDMISSQYYNDDAQKVFEEVVNRNKKENEN